MPPGTRLSAPFGSKLETWPYLLFSSALHLVTDAEVQRQVRENFQSSWKNREWIQLRGRLLSRFLGDRCT